MSMYTFRTLPGHPKQKDRLTVSMIKAIMLMDWAHRVPRSMIATTTAKALDERGLLKEWVRHLENVEQDEKVAYKKSDLCPQIEGVPLGEREVCCYHLSDRGDEIAATVNHLRSLRNMLATFNYERYRRERTSLTEKQYNMFTFIERTIQDLDPYNLTEEPVGAVTDRVLDGSAD